MTIGWMETGMLMNLYGLDEKDIADLNAALPAIQEVVATAEKEWPRINPHFGNLMRIFGKIIARERSLH